MPQIICSNISTGLRLAVRRLRQPSSSMVDARLMMRCHSTSSGAVPLLISAKDALALPKDTTKFVDASWHMPNSPRNPLTEYLSGPRPPNAVRWDLDKISTAKTTSASTSDSSDPEWSSSPLSQNPLGLPHMLPSPSLFSQTCSSLGITPQTHVVVYDTIGVFSSPRAGLMFSLMGHEKVSVLDGGLGGLNETASTVLEAEELKDVRSAEKPANYPVPKLDYSGVRGYDQMVQNSKVEAKDAEAELVLDARARERYTGTAPEPRPGLSSGHIPNSLSLPFSALLHNPTGRYTQYLSPAQLKQVFIRALTSPTISLELGTTISDEELALGRERWQEVKDGKRELVGTCGSGMTAAVVIWALRVVLEWETREAGSNATGAKINSKGVLYDESWTGYALRSESEIVKGES